VSAPKFDRGNRIRIAEDYHWAQHVIGTVEATLDPEATGCSRRVKSLEGVLTFDLVHFDEAHTDAEGDSGYMQAEIDECYLQKHAQI